MGARDFSVAGSMPSAILSFLEDGAERSVSEVASAIGSDKHDLVRNQLVRLADRYEVECRRMGVNNATVLYRIAARRQPFLLQQCWGRVAGEVRV